MKYEDIFDLTDFNFLTQTSMEQYDDRVKELKSAITKAIESNKFNSNVENVYGFYFFDLIHGDPELDINPQYIKTTLSPLGVEILTAHLQNIGYEIDNGVSLGEDFIADTLIKYFGGERLRAEDIKNKEPEDIFFVGISHNWELTVCNFSEEITPIERNPELLEDIKKYIQEFHKRHDEFTKTVLI